jgi:hypothetical protein
MFVPEHVQLHEAMPDGLVSVKETEDAAPGPLFVTVIV